MHLKLAVKLNSNSHGCIELINAISNEEIFIAVSDACNE
jgi:hypothetical protein